MGGSKHYRNGHDGCGERDGPNVNFTDHYRNGGVLQTGALRNGKKHGAYTLYYQDGRPWRHSRYLNGVCVGSHITYEYNNGRHYMASRTTYDSYGRVLTRIQYSPNGVILHHECAA